MKNNNNSKTKELLQKTGKKRSRSPETWRETLTRKEIEPKKKKVKRSSTSTAETPPRPEPRQRAENNGSPTPRTPLQTVGIFRIRMSITLPADDNPRVNFIINAMATLAREGRLTPTTALVLTTLLISERFNNESEEESSARPGPGSPLN